jgi:hypothetical protein
MRHQIVKTEMTKNYNLISLFKIHMIIVILCYSPISTQNNSINIDNNNNQFEDEFSNCLSLSCNIQNDPNCNLKWIYDQNNPDYISFKLTLTKPNYNSWFAIGFNPNQNRQMIGTNLIVIKFGSKFEVYNG